VPESFVRRRSLIGFFVGVPLALGVWAMGIEPNRLIVREVPIQLPGWPEALDNLRVAVLTDIHAGAPHVDLQKLEQVVSTVNQAEPDVVVLLGDYVIRGVLGGRFIEPQKIAAKLAGLRARLAVASVLGNHDWWYDGERVRRALLDAGIPVLEDDVLQVGEGSRRLWLAGLADEWTRGSEVESALQKVSDEGPVLVLTHNPDLFPHVPARVSLTLAGHTHGGQVRLPFLGSPIVPSRYGQRYVRGHVEEGGRHLFVSTGIGTSIIPVRLGVPPEIAIVRILVNRGNRLP